MHSNSPSSSPSLIRIAFPVIVSLTVALPSPIAKISHDLWSESKSDLPDPLTRLAEQRIPPPPPPPSFLPPRGMMAVPIATLVPPVMVISGRMSAGGSSSRRSPLPPL